MIEFLIVLVIFTIFLFSPLITLICLIVLSWFWSLKLTLSLFFLYLSWIYFDRNTDSNGGRWSDRLRRSILFEYFTNYFPLKLIKCEDLDPNRNYIFGFHPHGAFSFGALGNFGTDATHFSILFPRLRPHLMLLHLQFLFPFTRELLFYLGACCVSKDSCKYFLSGKENTGHALVIVVGGAKEMYLTKSETMKLYLKNRKGFIKLALEFGTSLVPVISFGENELYRQYKIFNKEITWGRFFFGHIPLQHPVVTVVGKAIHVNQKLDATSQDIDELHRKYVQSVEQLFDIHKNKYGLDHVKLEIV